MAGSPAAPLSYGTGSGHCSQLVTQRTWVLAMVSSTRSHSTFITADVQKFLTHALGWLLSREMENNKCWRGYGKTRTLVHCWLECKMMQLGKFSSSSKSYTQNCCMTQKFHLWSMYPKEVKAGTPQVCIYPHSQ